MNEIELARTLYVLRKLLAWSEAYKKGFVYSLWFKMKTFNEDVVLPSIYDNHGVCHYLNENKCSQLPFWLIDKITQTGSIAWPVKPFVEVYASREYAKTTFKEKWGNHPYAENRRQFIRDCIRELERLESLQNG